MFVTCILEERGGNVTDSHRLLPLLSFFLSLFLSCNASRIFARPTAHSSTFDAAYLTMLSAMCGRAGSRKGTAYVVFCLWARDEKVDNTDHLDLRYLDRLAVNRSGQISNGHVR